MDIGVYEIDRWHRGKGWISCGYHYVIRRNGEIEVGRDENEAGAHCIGYNKYSIGVCLVGGINEKGNGEVNYTNHQWVSLKKIVQELCEKYPKAKVYGHNDCTDNKTCPNFNVKAWYKDISTNKDDIKYSFNPTISKESQYYPKSWD